MRRLWDPLKSRSLMEQSLQGLPVHIEALGDRLVRLKHPETPNTTMWLQRKSSVPAEEPGLPAGP